jgi:hypothetical protein
VAAAAASPACRYAHAGYFLVASFPLQRADHAMGLDPDGDFKSSRRATHEAVAPLIAAAGMA